jgi:hypothetical protein
MYEVFGVFGAFWGKEREVPVTNTLLTVASFLFTRLVTICQ